MKFRKKLLAFFFPERCPLCGGIIDADAIACDKCLSEIRAKQKPIISGVMGFRCVSSFIYDGRIRRMLLRIKYHDKIQHIRQVSEILAKDIRDCYDGISFDMITFVPMYKTDFKERGYNQSEILAKELSRILGIPCVETLIKIKRTRKQHQLRYSERKTNLNGTFRIKDGKLIKGKRILIADDITTSGFTLGKCCRVLSRSNPDLICCAAIAKAEKAVDKSASI